MRFPRPPPAVFLVSVGTGGTFILDAVPTLLGFWAVGVFHALVVTPWTRRGTQSIRSQMRHFWGE